MSSYLRDTTLDDTYFEQLVSSLFLASHTAICQSLDRPSTSANSISRAA
jgi:hypothetical protein